jgi:hypothetical protein
MAVTPRQDGRFDVALTIQAKKLYADGKGVEREAPMAEPVDVGLFLQEPGNKAFSPSSILALEKRPIHSGKQIVTFVTSRKPVFGGVDPYNMLIDRNGDDNLFKGR